MNFLLLHLEAPLQSWGDSSVFDVRDTQEKPTKSGVLGMIAAALGIDRADLDEFRDLFKDCHFETETVSQGSRMVDFHMVGGGYSYDDEFESLQTLRTREGRRPVTVDSGPAAKITLRHYLQDYSFNVVVEIPDQIGADSVEAAFRNPTWNIYLGRKSCPPSDICFRGVYDSLEDVKEKIRNAA